MSRESLCIIGRCVTTQMRIMRNSLVRTNKNLVEDKDRQIKLDGTVFLNLTLGTATITQLVYLTPQVTRLFLSQKACQDLHVMALDLPAQMARTGRVAECTAMVKETNNIRGRIKTTKSEVLGPTKWNTARHIANKNSSNPRWTTDFQKLNKAKMCQKHRIKALPPNAS